MSQPATQPKGRVVPIRTSAQPAAKALPSATTAAQGSPTPDRLGRPLRDLRISVTDRCNFRCGYCMPRTAFGPDHPFLPHSELLSFEEITRVARMAMRLGVRKLRLTGGEPLLRKDIERLIAQLAELRTLDGQPPELTLTTNGSLLKRKAQALKDAGLQRVTVSLDALDEAMFARMSDSQLSVADVLSGIEAAHAVGLKPIKVNMVVQKGVNDQEILPLARHFRHTGVELRFIEFMDVGQTNRWQMDHVLPSQVVRARIEQAFALRPVAPSQSGDTAERWAYADGAGQVGFISSVTQAFCGDCSRLRMSTEGRLYTCLFASQGYELRSLLRDPALHDDAITARMAALWAQRDDRYSQLRGQPGQADNAIRQSSGPRIEMSYIGG
ncbi:MAG: GTP 3',8-cyclase MoaA [Aquabacterium sp.]|uniref:GTP 3',8-cyclase MoaA n=1 Tax=Aquabacterium sp. TaxID=1872578 RepID=UPI0025C47377|nr:GTP 3',8-cyclase MoaA [Aquabacterium sp.]MBI5925567.1 GTP 3',8-cyclase MoaA [Aquabacterium sp.]